MLRTGASRALPPPETLRHLGVLAGTRSGFPCGSSSVLRKSFREGMAVDSVGYLFSEPKFGGNPCEQGCEGEQWLSCE